MHLSAWFILVFAIALEVIGIAFMRYSEGLTRPWHTLGAAVFYLTSVSLIVVSAETIGIGVTYAVWSGLGTAAVAAMGAIVFKERLSVVRVLCISAIIAGVMGLKLLAPHAAPEAAHASEATGQGVGPASASGSADLGAPTNAGSGAAP